MWYTLGADVLVAIHVAYVTFIVLGLLAICAGIVGKWSWIRNFWFRFAHLTAITIVALEALLGIACPLTVWEDWLRQRAGLEVTGGDFIGRCLHRIIFYHFEPWVFTTCYVGVALLVLATFVLAPPRWRQAPTPLSNHHSPGSLG